MVSRGVMAHDIGVPFARAAGEPPEARGLRRDEVRLMVSGADGAIEHLRFRQLADVLRRGDLLVVNASGTMKAAVAARRTFGMQVDLHLSTQLPGGLWVVEVRESGLSGSKPLRLGMAGEVLRLPDGGRASILAPYPFAGDLFARGRLWSAALELPAPLDRYLDTHGRPIRYNYVARPWPLPYYQTIFATEMGSAEMPSAGRPFTEDLLDQLTRGGIAIAPIVLHTGVSSLEDHEPPYEERFRVSRATAAVVNQTRAAGHRVIAVGTTVVRALETVTDDTGTAHPAEGWTDLVIAADRPLRAVDGLITGLHEPAGSHLSVVRAVVASAGLSWPHVIDRAYEEAAERGYLLHEFGDSHLITST
jgi:S-adenosylmethionine:tRNA ribosyltransferase-isomerase